MAVVLRCLDVVGHVEHSAPEDPRGCYLKSYDPEAFDGRGECEWTPALADALRVPDMRAALELLYAVPKARPRRRDGKVNRPLMTFTVQLDPLEDA